MTTFNLSGKMRRSEALAHLKASILAETDTFADAETSKATAAGETMDVEENLHEDFTMNYLDEINNRIEALQAKLENNNSPLQQALTLVRQYEKTGKSEVEAIRAAAGDLRMDPQELFNLLQGPMWEAKEEEADIDLDAPEEDSMNLDMDLDTPQGEESIDVDSNGVDDMQATGEDGSIYDSLAAAFKGAQATGDEKLINQIANTITYFNKTHILKRG